MPPAAPAPASDPVAATVTWAGDDEYADVLGRLRDAVTRPSTVGDLRETSPAPGLVHLDIALPSEGSVRLYIQRENLYLLGWRDSGGGVHGLGHGASAALARWEPSAQAPGFGESYTELRNAAGRELIGLTVDGWSLP